VYVIGGRGSALDAQAGAILALTPGSRRVWRAGSLPVPLSDAGVASSGRNIFLAGGRDFAGRVRDDVWTLSPR
jgi:hypothetical protein